MTQHDNDMDTPVAILNYDAVIDYIKSDNISWFEERKEDFSHDEIEQIFYHCCSHNSSFALIDAIIAMGVTEFNHGCVKGALANKHLALLNHILLNYGKEHQINLFLAGETDTPYQLHVLMIDPQWHASLQVVLDNMPNHNQPIKKLVKRYQMKNYFSTLYREIYTFLLGVALAQKGEKKCDDAVIDKAIEMIARKKFPIAHYEVQSIYQLGMAHLFKGRLKRDTFPNLVRRDMMASHTILVPPYPYAFLDMHDITDNKVRIFQRVAHEIGMPDDLTYFFADKIGGLFYSLDRNKIINYREVIPPEQLLFIESIAHKKYFFAFLCKYFNYERSVLHAQLQQEIVENDDNAISEYVKI